MCGKGARQKGETDFAHMVAWSHFARGKAIGGGVTQIDDVAAAFGEKRKGGLGG